MMEFLNGALGLDAKNDDLAWSQVLLRALLIYLAGLILVRLSDRRFLGKNSTFDIILGFIFGSMLSRAINGTAPFGETLLAGAGLLALHWIFGLLSFKSHRFGTFVKGSSSKLVEAGRVDWDAM